MTHEEKVLLVDILVIFVRREGIFALIFFHSLFPRQASSKSVPVAPRHSESYSTSKASKNSSEIQIPGACFSLQYSTESKTAL